MIKIQNILYFTICLNVKMVNKLQLWFLFLWMLRVFLDLKSNILVKLIIVDTQGISRPNKKIYVGNEYVLIMHS